MIIGCGKTEEPAKEQKPAAEKKATTKQKPAVKQKATAVKEAPAHKEAEHKEHHPKHKHQKPEPTRSEEKHGQKSDLNQALLAYLAKKGDDPKNANPHKTAKVDLNSDGHQDALVLLENPYFCGTGGCTMLVFKGTKSGFEFVSRSSLIRSPVLVSETKTHGWRDLILEVSGGGATPKRVALKHTGSKYPPNPSTQPALPKNQAVKGTKAF
jgi:putative lipoprotein